MVMIEWPKVDIAKKQSNKLQQFLWGPEDFKALKKYYSNQMNKIYMTGSPSRFVETKFI